jgi:hypothetical protein
MVSLTSGCSIDLPPDGWQLRPVFRGRILNMSNIGGLGIGRLDIAFPLRTPDVIRIDIHDHFNARIETMCMNRHVVMRVESEPHAVECQ